MYPNSPTSSSPASDSKITSHGYGKIRWLVLLLACSLLFGNYYAYDLPAALNTPLREYLGSSEESYNYQINLLYSVYSLPNLLLPFFGGALIDKFGSRTLMLVLSTFICCGQLAFSIGIVWKSFTVMAIGRVMFGLGGESLSVAQTRLTTRFFKGKELAFALGVNLSVARMGSVANDIISPWIGERYGVPTAMWVGLLTCIMSFGCSVGLAYIDAKHSLDAQYHHLGSSSSGNLDSDTLNLLPNSPITQHSHHHAEGNVSIRQILEFPLPFWLICGILVFLYGTVIPFNTIHQAFLQSKSWWYPNEPVKAAQIMGVPDTISALLVPFVGTFCDYIGYRTHVLMVCSLIITVCHLSLGYATPGGVPSPVPPLIFLGFAYACLLTFWPCVPLIIRAENLATAYGLLTASWNLCNFTFPMIVASLLARDPTFTYTETFFALLGFMGTITAITLWWVDENRYGGILRLPEMRNIGTLHSPNSRKASDVELFDMEFDNIGTYARGKDVYTKLDDSHEEEDLDDFSRRSYSIGRRKSTQEEELVWRKHDSSLSDLDSGG